MLSIKDVHKSSAAEVVSKQISDLGRSPPTGYSTNQPVGLTESHPSIVSLGDDAGWRSHDGIKFDLASELSVARAGGMVGIVEGDGDQSPAIQAHLFPVLSLRQIISG